MKLEPDVDAFLRSMDDLMRCKRKKCRTQEQEEESSCIQENCSTFLMTFITHAKTHFNAEVPRLEKRIAETEFPAWQKKQLRLILEKDKKKAAFFNELWNQRKKLSKEDIQRILAGPSAF